MLEEQAIVVGITGKYAEVQIQRQNTCAHCTLSQGCGTGAIGRLLGQRSRPMFIKNTVNLNPGDRLLLGLPEYGFLRASLLIYGLPLGLLIITAILAQILFNGAEILLLMAAGAGFTGGLLLSSRLTNNRQLSAQLSPRILQINGELTQSF